MHIRVGQLSVTREGPGKAFHQGHLCVSRQRQLRVALIAFSLLLWLGLSPGPLLAASGTIRPQEIERVLFAEDVGDFYLCPRNVMLRTPERCPPYGPGARQVRIEFLRAALPNPLPELAVEEMEVPEDAITPYTYAYVRNLPASTYRHPAEATAGLPPLRQFLAGDNWVSVMGSVEFEGQLWYEINTDEYIRAEHLAFTRPSRFHGVILTEQPRYPFGWINRDVRPSITPAGPERTDVVLHRYDRITIFAQEPLGSQLWYMVGPDQWIEQSYTARVDVDPPPEGVKPGEKWLEINTFEQTLAAYQGERMVFATLVSSGRPGTWTPDVLSRIWGKLPTTPMRNQDAPPSSPLWYYLEDVQWTQYFYEAYALHAAYWHDSFGFTRSHGCVNLSILDAKWLFAWTRPYTSPDEKITYSTHADPGTWVWVHRTPPSPNVKP